MVSVSHMEIHIIIIIIMLLVYMRIDQITHLVIDMYNIIHDCTDGSLICRLVFDRNIIQMAM